MDSTSSQERMISETITHELTGENNGEKATEGPQNEDGEGDEGDEEDDEVYEIEKILHHSKNMFVSVVFFRPICAPARLRDFWVLAKAYL